MTLRPSLQDVLSSFSVEPDTSRETLERYMLRYPEYAPQLIDLSQELSRTLSSYESELSQEEGEAIEAAWASFLDATTPVDVFASLGAADFSRLAQALAIPRQVLTAIKERRVTLSTFPKAFLRKLANEIGRSFEDVFSTLSLPKAAAVRSFKSDEKPVATSETVTFEEVLRQAGVPEDGLAELLRDDE
ncbi:MAG TPA: hypothetical protein VG757_07870 [Devosia sp.]|nr:hypothetical protein [Devosia sp.]